jgi:SHS2 domain-containing protein
MTARPVVPSGSSSDRDGSGASERAGAGHRLAARTADRTIEAWGPDRVSCLSEAVLALVEVFADLPDAPATSLVPVATRAGSDEDVLVSLLEEVIYVVDVFSAVPVRVHLAEAEDGGVAGDLEVVPARGVGLRGPVPKAVSCHELVAGPVPGGWRCRVLVDV